MLQFIYDVWSSVKRKGSIKVSESLVLRHMWNSQLRKDNKDIKWELSPRLLAEPWRLREPAV